MRIIVSVVLMVLALKASSQEYLDSVMRSRDEYYFEFVPDGGYDMGEVSRKISIDRIVGDKVVAYANVSQYEDALSLGVSPTLLTPPSMLRDYAMYDGRTRSGYSWDQYPTYEAYESMMYEFAEEYPEQCSLIELGALPSGRKILVARINNGITENKPKFLYVSTIHGDETTGFMLLLRLIDCLLANAELPEVRDIVDNMDVFICPNANPDGTYYSGNHTVYGSRRYNADGIDLNRNYPDSENGLHPDGEYYAPETEMFMQFADDYRFTMSATFHGGAELVNYPWDNSYERHVDDEWWRYVSREYADLAHEHDDRYMTDRDNGITNGADWYVITGSRQDYMNYYRQCREVTIECSLQKCPSSYEMPEFWSYNYNSMIAYMSQCMNGIHGRVVDARTKEGVEAVITILGHDEGYSVVETQPPYGDFHRPIKAGEYIVEIKSEGYVTVYETVAVEDGSAVMLDVEMQIGDAYNMKDGTVITSNAYFYDSGGVMGNYPDNDFHVMTIKPGEKGSMIQVEFLVFSTEENRDELLVYDGASVDADRCVAVLSGTMLPGTITATNAEGALTFRFLSDYANNYEGWEAVVRCVMPDNVGEDEYDDVVAVYPSPARDVVNIETKNGERIRCWTLYDLRGETVMKSYTDDTNVKINVDNVKGGLYMLAIDVGDKQKMNKIVIE